MIYTSKNISELKNIPILDDGQIYLYVMLNYPQNNIKIGITTNIIQRLQSLSGSNSGGNKIIKLWLSDPTYVLSSENAFHNHYDIYRIPNTEWFDGRKLKFEDVVKYIEEQFNKDSYKKCNKLRKELYEKECKNKSENNIEKEEQLLLKNNKSNSKAKRKK